MKQQVSRLRMLFAITGIGCVVFVVASTAFAAVQDVEDRGATAAQKAAIARGATMKVSAVARPPKIIAVRVHHDMCPYCKQLDPQYAELIRRTQDESVLFVTMDMTIETSQRQSALLAGALGL